MEAVELYPEAAKMPLFWANLAAEEKIIVNQGGTFSGKSHGLIRVLFFFAIYYPDIKIEIVGATVPKLTGDTLEIAEDIAQKNLHIKDCISKYNITNRTFYFRNGSKIIFKSYEFARDADGPKRDILYISEARNFEWATAEQLIKRTKWKVFIDYNPVETFWCHDKIINCPVGPSGKKEYNSVKVIRSWHIHNNFISAEKHEEIENIADKEMHKAYARGLTATLSGMVYPNWDQIETFPLCTKIIWGMDIGYTNDPTVVVKIGMDPYTVDEAGNKIPLPYDYIFEELCYTPGIVEAEIARTMVDYGYNFGDPLYMDHDKSIRRNLRAIRIVAVFAVKGQGSIAARVLHLKSKRCAYTKKSVNIHEERKRYMFHVDKDGHILNEPKKGFDHAMNACEYGAFSFAVRHGLIKGYVVEEE